VEVILMPLLVAFNKNRIFGAVGTDKMSDDDYGVPTGCVIAVPRVPPSPPTREPIIDLSIPFSFYYLFLLEF
jgi:hypothetical protein